MCGWDVLANGSGQDTILDVEDGRKGPTCGVSPRNPGATSRSPPEVPFRVRRAIRSRSKAVLGAAGSSPPGMPCYGCYAPFAAWTGRASPVAGSVPVREATHAGAVAAAERLGAGGPPKARAIRPVLRWTSEQLAGHQERRWRAVARVAAERAPYYRELYRGLDLERVPLAELPPVGKAQLMDRFDDAMTEPALRLADLEAFLRTASAKDVFQGRFQVLATSGLHRPTGHRRL